MLSSATLAMTQSSLGFQEKSGILLVWPPWMNSNDAGPSSASSGVCSSLYLFVCYNTHNLVEHHKRRLKLAYKYLMDVISLTSFKHFESHDSKPIELIGRLFHQTKLFKASISHDSEFNIT